MFGGFGVGLFAWAGWIPPGAGAGSRAHKGWCFRAHQNCLYSSKHREAPRLSDPKQLKDPKEKPGSTGASDGAQPTTCISKGTGMSHTGKLFSRRNSPAGRDLQQSPRPSIKWFFWQEHECWWEGNSCEGDTHCASSCYLSQQTNGSQNKVKDKTQKP